jgi:hypothetical protein
MTRTRDPTKTRVSFYLDKNVVADLRELTGKLKRIQTISDKELPIPTTMSEIVENSIKNVLGKENTNG